MTTPNEARVTLWEPLRKNARLEGQIKDPPPSDPDEDPIGPVEDPDDWASGTDYKYGDFVKHSNKYWSANEDMKASASNSPDASRSDWTEVTGSDMYVFGEDKIKSLLESASFRALNKSSHEIRTENIFLLGDKPNNKEAPVVDLTLWISCRVQHTYRELFAFGEVENRLYTVHGSMLLEIGVKDPLGDDGYARRVAEKSGHGTELRAGPGFVMDTLYQDVVTLFDSRRFPTDGDFDVIVETSSFHEMGIDGSFLKGSIEVPFRYDQRA